MLSISLVALILVVKGNVPNCKYTVNSQNVYTPIGACTPYTTTSSHKVCNGTALIEISYFNNLDCNKTGTSTGTQITDLVLNNLVTGYNCSLPDCEYADIIEYSYRYSPQSGICSPDTLRPEYSFSNALTGTRQQIILNECLLDDPSATNKRYVNYTCQNNTLTKTIYCDDTCTELSDKEYIYDNDCVFLSRPDQFVAAACYLPNGNGCTFWPSAYQVTCTTNGDTESALVAGEIIKPAPNAKSDYENVLSNCNYVSVGDGGQTRPMNACITGQSFECKERSVYLQCNGNEDGIVKLYDSTDCSGNVAMTQSIQEYYADDGNVTVYCGHSESCPYMLWKYYQTPDLVTCQAKDLNEYIMEAVLINACVRDDLWNYNMYTCDSVNGGRYDGFKSSLCTECTKDNTFNFFARNIPPNGGCALWIGFNETGDAVLANNYFQYSCDNGITWYPDSVPFINNSTCNTSDSNNIATTTAPMTTTEAMSTTDTSMTTTTTDTSMTTTERSMTTAMTTAGMTTEAVFSETWTMSLDGDFDALVTYLENNNITLTVFGYNVVIFYLKTNTDVGLLIISVTKGSILIEYTLSSNDENKFKLARGSIADSIGESYIIGEFSFELLWARRSSVINNTSKSNYIPTFSILIFCFIVLIHIIL